MRLPRLLHFGFVIDHLKRSGSSVMATTTATMTTCAAAAVVPKGPVDVTSIPKHNVYLAVGEFSCQAGKANDFAKGMEASMAKFYRSQPGVHVYLAGICEEEPDTVLLLMVASNKELFHSLPKSPEDLDKLNAARGPFFGLLASSPEESRRFSETEFTVGKLNMQLHLPTAVPDDATTGIDWDSIMGKDVTIEPSKVGSIGTLFAGYSEYTTSEGKAEEVSKGLDATQGAYYRQIPECLLYLNGVKNSTTAMALTLWTSREAFEAQPDNPELNQARAPYRSLMVSDGGMRIRSTSAIMGPEGLFKTK